METQIDVLCLPTHLTLVLGASTILPCRRALGRIC